MRFAEGLVVSMLDRTTTRGSGATSKDHRGAIRDGGVSSQRAGVTPQSNNIHKQIWSQSAWRPSPESRMRGKQPKIRRFGRAIAHPPDSATLTPPTHPGRQRAAKAGGAAQQFQAQALKRSSCRMLLEAVSCGPHERPRDVGSITAI